jgi:hypothetical protein
MSRWGIDCVLVRDLTDSLYNPAKPPFVSHEEGTELVIRHIEQYWCPSILSDDLIKPAQDEAMDISLAAALVGRSDEQGGC